MSQAPNPNCCCESADVVLDCNDSPFVDLQNLSATFTEVCPTTISDKVVVSGRTICFKLKPGDVVSDLLINADVDVTNDSNCAIEITKARLTITSAVGVCGDCGTGVQEDIIDYHLDEGCQQILSFAFTFAGPFASCCVITIKLELEATCCAGDPLKSCSGSVDSLYGPRNIIAADIGAGWQSWQSGLSVKPCSGRQCKANEVTKIFEYLFTNTSGKCVQILLRHANIVSPGSCELRRGRPLDNCPSLAMVSGSYGGAFAFVCLAHTGTTSLSTIWGYSMQTNEGCCDDPEVTFDVEIKVTCVEFGSCDLCIAFGTCSGCPSC